MRRRRDILALAALALWIAGFELAPNLHVGLHHLLPSHDHHGAASQVSGYTSRGRVRTVPGDGRARSSHVHAHAHPHGSDGHDHGHDHEPAPEPTGEHGPGASPAPEHGAHSLAHRGLAALAPPPAIAPLIPAPFVLLPAPGEATAAPPALPRGRPNQRGPPV